jgi:hypothetical protein
MLHYAVASLIRVHGIALRYARQSGKQRSIGFQPVFFRTIERRVAKLPPFLRDAYKDQG